MFLWTSITNSYTIYISSAGSVYELHLIVGNITWHHGRFSPPWNCFVPLFRHVPLHHFKKKLPYQIQCWLCINCGRAFVWENSNSSGGGNILLIKIKIKWPAGQNLEIMTFRYLKTLIFDKVFKKITLFDVFLFEQYIISDN